MTPDQLRALCLSFNAAVEDFPFNPETAELYSNACDEKPSKFVRAPESTGH